jgi:hypothetical protein
MIATCISLALCLAYLSCGHGCADWLRNDNNAAVGTTRYIFTTGITNANGQVLAGISPQGALHAAVLRLIDTAVGVAVGVACRWQMIGMFLFRWLRENDDVDATVKELVL